MKYPSWLPILLGFLSAIGPISTDMYLPAFPAIEASLGLAAGTAQITLATWFLGLAIGQISQGPLADRFGRRIPLMIGVLIYTVANAGCALAPDLLTLSLLRFLAAVGGSASMVIPRAIVRDLAEGHAAARLMSRLVLIMGIAPILAPSLGGIVLAAAGWHTIFWICTIYGALNFILVTLFLPDTLPPEYRLRQNFMSAIARFGDILPERSFLTHTLIGSAGMFGMFAYIGGSPGVLIDTFHVSPGLYAVVFSACAINYIAGSQVTSFALRRFGADKVLRKMVWVFFAAAVVLVIVAYLQLPVWWAIVPPIMVCLFCQGVMMPLATVGALQRHASHAGSASALMGTVQFCLGALATVLVSVFADGTARALATLMLIGTIGALLADRGRRRILIKQ